MAKWLQYTIYFDFKETQKINHPNDVMKFMDQLILDTPAVTHTMLVRESDHISLVMQYSSFSKHKGKDILMYTQPLLEKALEMTYASYEQMKVDGGKIDVKLRIKRY